jgi:hypothetical protein
MTAGPARTTLIAPPASAPATAISSAEGEQRRR